MARKKDPPCPPLALWLVTFSDLVTLLLTFFVLLLTMASMDQSFLTRVTVMPLDMGPMDTKGGGQISIKLMAVLEYMENPWEVMEKQNRIKDLLYPDEVLPDDISKSTLEENMKVLVKDDGVALVFTDKLLFPVGGSELDDSARAILNQILPMLEYMSEPIRISGYADDQEAQPYEVAMDRAIAVLTYYVEQGMANDRFSLSTAGADKPLVTGDSDAARAQNRR
ncbi:MAG: OmpA family protein, partial [Proteobacteria bacterium]|nr:OmpA family protein [Pseudomonadota bacterium]